MKSKMWLISRILFCILATIALFLFLVYKIFGLTYLTWLYGIIGPQTYTAKFQMNGATWISEEELTCVTDKTMLCEVVAPDITKPGAIIVGWSYEKDSKEASFIPGDRIPLEVKETTFYAITKPRIEISKVLKIDALTVEFENGLEFSKNINLRMDSLNKLYERWPFMFKYRDKLSVLKKDSFEKYNDISYDGAVHWGEGYIDIKESNSDYTIIHELAHALDFNCTKGLYRITYKISNWRDHRYDTIYNYDLVKLISESDEYAFLGLYEKYKDYPSNKRPLKDYSYTNEREFFADALTYYYDYKYEKEYYNIVNKEIKNAVEELIADINSGKICNNVINQEIVNEFGG